MLYIVIMDIKETSRYKGYNVYNVNKRYNITYFIIMDIKGIRGYKGYNHMKNS